MIISVGFLIKSDTNCKTISVKFLEHYYLDVPKLHGKFICGFIWKALLYSNVLHRHFLLPNIVQRQSRKRSPRNEEEGGRNILWSTDWQDGNSICRPKWKTNHMKSHKWTCHASWEHHIFSVGFFENLILKVVE